MEDVDTTGWYELPWLDLKHAAGLAAELCRYVMPVPLRIQRRGGDPYRGEHEVTRVVRDGDARHHVTKTLEFIECYARGEIDKWHDEDDDVSYGDDASTRVYWIARSYGGLAKMAVYNVDVSGNVDEIDPSTSETLARWMVTGECLEYAVKIVQKHVSDSAAGGHAPNALLAKIVDKILQVGIVDGSSVADIVCKWRYRDALRTNTPSEKLRVTFAAAWFMKRHQLAYDLLDDAWKSKLG